MERQIENPRGRGVPEVATVENPPGSETMFEGPAWTLPEVKEIMDRIEAHAVEFNTCAFMSRVKVRFFKPAKWAGKLEGLKKLNRVCKCPARRWRQTRSVSDGAVQRGGTPCDCAVEENFELGILEVPAGDEERRGQ